MHTCTNPDQTFPGPVPCSVQHTASSSAQQLKLPWTAASHSGELIDVSRVVIEKVIFFFSFLATADCEDENPAADERALDGYTSARESYKVKPSSLIARARALNISTKLLDWRVSHRKCTDKALVGPYSVSNLTFSVPSRFLSVGFAGRHSRSGPDRSAPPHAGGNGVDQQRYGLVSGHLARSISGLAVSFKAR